MKKSLAWSLVLSAFSLVPLQAETVYVPVIEPMSSAGAPLATQLWISNYDGVERSYSTTLLPDQEGAEAKAASATVPAKRAVYLDRAAAQGETACWRSTTTRGSCWSTPGSRAAAARTSTTPACR